MTNINEFMLICTLKKQFDREPINRFGNNFNRDKFAKFKNRLKFEVAQLFPVNEKGKQYEDKILSEHLTTVRRVNKEQYVAAGCVYRRFAGATIKVQTMKVEALVVELSYTVHNFVAYKNIIIAADYSQGLFVTSLDSRADRQIALTDYKLCSDIRGCNALTCGLNMEMDTHKPFYHMAYLMCEQNKLVRFNLKHIDPLNPKATADKLDIKVVYQSNSHAIFYVACKHVYVMSDNKLTKIDKTSLKAKEYDQQIEGDAIYRIVGDDHHIYAMSGATMHLLAISQNSVTKLDSIVSKTFDSALTRMLIPCQFRGVNFVVRLHESPVVISVYASLRKKLHIILEHKVDTNNDQVLGGIYDHETERIIISLEYHGSQTFKLTY